MVYKLNVTDHADELLDNYDIEDNCSYQQNLPIIHELCRFFGYATIAFGDISK